MIFYKCSTKAPKPLLLLQSSIMATPTNTSSLCIGFRLKPLIIQGFHRFGTFGFVGLYHYLSSNVRPLFDQKANQNEYV